MAHSRLPPLAPEMSLLCRQSLPSMSSGLVEQGVGNPVVSRIKEAGPLLLTATPGVGVSLRRVLLAAYVSPS